MTKAQKELDDIRARQFTANDKWLMMKDDSALAKTPAGKKQQEAALKEVVMLTADSLIAVMEIQNEQEKLKPLFKRIDHVADSIGKSRALKQVRDVGDNSAMLCPPDQMLMTDITNDIAIAMHVKPKLVKIGLYNSDSLMRLMPGYIALADSSAMEMMVLKIQLAEKQLEIDVKQLELDTMRKEWSRRQISNREKEIAEMQDEYDTYRGYELYKLDVRDSIRMQDYRKKFRAALKASIKQYGCYRVYEIHDAQTDWTAKEAEFIDLNATIAEKLRQ